MGVVHLLGSREQLPHDGAHDRLGWRRYPSAVALAEEVVEARADALHDKGEVHGGRVAGEAVEADDERVVAAAHLEQAGLPQQLHLAADVSSSGEALDGDGLAGGTVARLDDGAEGAHPEAARLLVVIGGADDARPVVAGRSRGARVADGGGCCLYAGGH